MKRRSMANNYKNSIISDEKRKQLWLSDLCVKYGELTVTPSASSLSSSCYSGCSGTTTESATDFEIDQILMGVQDGSECSSSWLETGSEDTASSYEYYWSKSQSDRSLVSDSLGHEGDESSEGEDPLEAKTPVAQVYSYGDSPEKTVEKSESPPPFKQSAHIDKQGTNDSGLSLAAPFGDPITKWTTSKQNLLLFGPSNFDKSKGTYEHDDTQSVSTVSGSGMDFFRKFVQRKGPNIQKESNSAEKDCKECESQFRREVLIDRLVADALHNQGKQNSSEGSSTRRSSESSAESTKFIGKTETENKQVDLVSRSLESSCSSGKCPKHQGSQQDDAQSIISSMSESTVSGTGLLFLRNYLKKKNTAAAASNDTTLMADEPLNSEATMICDSHQQMVFNTVPIPFPPKNEFYGPAVYIPDDVAFCQYEEGSRRNSYGSTIADLLNDNFDSEDSELKNLDWEEWEEESHETDLDSKQSGTDTDDSSIVVDVLDMAQPVVDLGRVESKAETEFSFQTDTSEPTYEELESIKVKMPKQSTKKNKFTIPFLDLPSPPSSDSSGSVTPTVEDDLTSLCSTPCQERYSQMSNETTKSSESNISLTGARPKESREKQDMNYQRSMSSKNRLAQFWERRVSASYDQGVPYGITGAQVNPMSSSDNASKFKVAIPPASDLEGTRKSNEKIQRFLEATRRAADDSSVSVWSSNYDKLKRGELTLPED